MPTALLVILALVPFVVLVTAIPVPPLLDYPNHLARLWLLAGQGGPSAYYAADWSNAFTNSAMDAVVVVISPVMGGVESATRLMVLLALVLPPLGAALLNRSVFGRWSIWHLAFPILAFNGILVAGFLSFLIGIGLALALASAEPALARRSVAVRLMLRAVFSVLLLTVHALGMSLYLALVTGIALGPSVRVTRADAGRLLPTLRRALAAVLSVALPASLALIATGAPEPWSVEAGERLLLPPWTGYGVVEKVRVLTTAFGTYDVFVDLPMFVAVMAIARWSLARGRLGTHDGLLVTAGGLLALALVMPSTLGGTGWMDRRFPIMALLTFMAALRPEIPSRRAMIATGLVLLSLARTAWIGGIWHERQADVAAVERAVANMPRCAALLTAFEVPTSPWDAPAGRYIPRGQRPTFEHLSALAVVRRDAFVPTLFALRGRHPLRVEPPWDEVSVAHGLGVAVPLLNDPREVDARPYLDRWRERFDYLLVIDPDHPAPRGIVDPSPGLTLVANEGFARLYRIGTERRVQDVECPARP